MRVCDAPGIVIFKVEGKDLSGLDNETGGHRFQRIPPTERKGRVHTSTVTVASLQQVGTSEKYLQRRDEDFMFEPFKATGPGGQHRNKTMSAIRCIHIPTGLKQERSDRCQHKNRRDARAALEDMLDSAMENERNSASSAARKGQVGSGMRGDKRRTYRFQDDQVTDDITGRSTRLKDVLKNGKFDLLW